MQNKINKKYLLSERCKTKTLFEDRKLISIKFKKFDKTSHI